VLVCDLLPEIGGEGSWFAIAMGVIAVASSGLGRAAIGALQDSSLLARFLGKAELFKSAESTLMDSDVWLKDGEDGLREALPEAWAEGETARRSAKRRR
jgi:hypothetical protein